MHPLDITDTDRLQDLLSQRRNGKARMICESDMNSTLKKRVRGQDHIIDHLCRFIRLQWGKERRKKPIANLLFVGPPATGKTELAKAMTEYLFDDEKHMLRFDCSEFSGVEGKTRLIGTPPGYDASKQGGQLTRPMFANPKRLVLFDEIEKAYVGIFDLLLSIMGEGHLTEQVSNRKADFTQSLIVLTSNAQHEEIGRLTEQIDDPFELAGAVRSILKEAQTFRPEIISRFDQVYVFKPLAGIVNAEIAAIKIAGAAKEYGVEIDHIDAEIVYDIMELADQAQDTRELARLVDSKLGDLLLKAREDGLERVRISADESWQPQLQPAEMGEGG